MIDSIQKTSILVPSQLPEWIRDDENYKHFVYFLQAYYQWLEQEGNVLDYSKNIPNYQDIDKTTDQFMQYFINDFLPYFPEDALISKTKALKFAKELYQTKGTPASYQFLFRVLYNSDCDIVYTKDFVFKASSGNWYVPRSLKLATDDPNFLSIANYRIFGETSKSLAVIESALQNGLKTEIFISDVQRLFLSGEYVKILDYNYQDVYFLNGNRVDKGTPGSELLRAKLVGQISQINIDPSNRGSYYQQYYPVVVYGGLNAEILNPVGAKAEVGDVTTGILQSIQVVDGGWGYRTDPNTQIVFPDLSQNAPIAAVSITLSSLLPYANISNPGFGYQNNDPIYVNYQSVNYHVADVKLVNNLGQILQVNYVSGTDENTILGLSANVVSSNANAHGAVITFPSNTRSSAANLTYAPINTLQLAQNITIGSGSYTFTKSSANANTKLSNGLDFVTFQTYSIGQVAVENGGGGLTTSPKIQALAVYDTDIATSTSDISDTAHIYKLGILSPIQVLGGGNGYRVNDAIVFSGGSGYGAYANVTNVTPSGAITEVTYYQGNLTYPLGGMGYKSDSLPTLSVKSANSSASGASLVVTGILGAGAVLSGVTSQAGQITTINVIDNGQDYTSAPNLSLKIQDFIVHNLSPSNFPKKGDVVYQGSSLNNSTWNAYVESVTFLTTIQNVSYYNLRVYNYNTYPDPNKTIYNVNNNPVNATITNNKIISDTINGLGLKIGNLTLSYSYDTNIGIYGFNSYGDGKAKAVAQFLNGLVIGQGQYLDTSGQPSSYSVLQNEDYNNFTYKLTVEKEISKYKNILLNLLHPAGLKVLGRFSAKSQSDFIVRSEDELLTGRPLYSANASGIVGSYVTMVTDFVNKSNNIITFNNIDGANLNNFIYTNSIIQLTPTNGPNVRSSVLSVNATSNQVTLSTNTWLTFSNIAYTHITAGSNVINIDVLTGAYNIINDGVYSDPNYPLKDIAYVGDNLKISNYPDSNDFSTEDGLYSILLENGTDTLISEVSHANAVFTITQINYAANTISVIAPAGGILSYSNTFVSVNRTFVAYSTLTSDQVRIYGQVGYAYYPEISNELGQTITTEDGRLILLG